MADYKPLIATWPEALRHADFARLKFSLDFTTPCRVQPALFLDLGRLLRLTARQVNGRRSELFRRELSDDPVALRRHQKPSQAFVVRMPLTREQLFDCGDVLDLEILFLGNGIPSIHIFLERLMHLGRLGLVDGQGQFEVTGVHNASQSQADGAVWLPPESPADLSPEVSSLHWWLESHLPQQSPLTLEFLLPTRLLVDGRPLRRPRFDQVFPFILRRVTSMLYACCAIEPVVDPRFLLAKAAEVDVQNRQLRWQDWRPLASHRQAIGGFVGSMELAGESLEEILWVLATATLFGLGKSASYGAGGLQLCVSQALPADKCTL